MFNAEQILKTTFGYDSFRFNQEEIIASILNRRDTFVLMPTGGGKSLCYQIPGLMLSGLTVVVSPLIALMKDQVDALRLNGITAEYLNSSLDYLEQQYILDRLRQNELKFLYIAPEKLLGKDQSFLSFLKSRPISRLASGIAIGSDLEYADQITLGKAFEARTVVR
jgi:ATP-dependent DNA helicase RecQ